MGPVGLVARHDLRRRWWRLVALTVVVGVAGAGVLATVAGARRTSTSLERFQRTNRSADVEFAVGGATRAQVDRLRRVPGVAAVGQLRAFGLTVPRVPDFFSVGSVEDHEFGVTVDRSRLVAGWVPNPRAPDEVTVGEGFAARAGLHAGDRFAARSFTVEQIQQTLSGTSDVGAQAGPTLRLRAVGIVRRPLDLGDRAASGGLLVLTPAFAEKYQGRIGVFGDRLRVRTNTPADVPGVLRAAKRVFGPRLFLAQSLAIETQGASNAIDVAAVALWIGAAVGAVAACVALGIVLARDTTIAAVDLTALGELGCTRVQRTLVFGPGASLVAIGGATLGVAGAIALSPFFPFGVARRADPDVGVHADLPVLVLGALVIVGFVGFVSLAAAYRAASRRSVDAGATVVARPTFAARLARHGSRPSVTNGVRMALEPGRGRARVPVRSAIAGAVLGVAGITAALLFAASLDLLAADPARYGSAWDFKVIDLTSNTPCGQGGRGLDDVPGVAAVTEVCSQNVQVDGRPTPALAFRRVKGTPIRPTIVAGRSPALPSEVALGAKTLTVLHKGVGDRVRVSTRSGSGDYRIVGRAVFPSVGPAQPLADGVALTGAGYAPIFDQNIFLRAFVGRYTGAADRTAVARDIGALDRFGELSGPAVPTEIDRLRQVDWLPVALAALLGLLASVAVTHALVVGARRRDHDLALLKALGFTRRDVRATVAWQATTLAAIGLLVGVPVGLFVGQLVWRRVADGLGVTVDPAVPLVALAVLVVVVVVLVNAVALVPARRASRLTPAAALRAE